MGSRSLYRSWGVLGAVLLAVHSVCAQPLITSYDLIPPEWKPPAGHEAAANEEHQLPKYTEPNPQPTGPSNFGLSISRQWSARIGLTRDEHPELMSVGGSYAWQEGESVSLQLARSKKESLGLALRYERPAYYLGLGYEGRPKSTTPWDSLLFTGGLRF